MGTDKMSAKVSIIIPCKCIDDYTKQCIEYCKELDYNDFEIIVLPDVEAEPIADVRIIPTGAVTPGKKRNIGVAKASGEFCAFIDSDAYPRKDWLKNAINYLADEEIAGVGGPGLTPQDDSLLQKVSGAILSSFMVGKELSARYKAKGILNSDDIHSCNFIARRSVLEEIGGWNEHYWPGEDTLLCLAIKKIGGRMVEAPDVVVYHHRRPLLIPHLRQIWNFGLHRGFFAKKFPETSRKPIYFFPSLFLIGLAGGVATSPFNSILARVFLAILGMYILLALVASFSAKDLKQGPLVFIGIFLTHLTYGAAFIKGLFARRLAR